MTGDSWSRLVAPASLPVPFLLALRISALSFTISYLQYHANILKSRCWSWESSSGWTVRSPPRLCRNAGTLPALLQLLLAAFAHRELNLLGTPVTRSAISYTPQLRTSPRIRNPFRINTYRKSIRNHFRINTYEKEVGGSSFSRIRLRHALSLFPHSCARKSCICRSYEYTRGVAPLSLATGIRRSGRLWQSRRRIVRGPDGCVE